MQQGFADGPKPLNDHPKDSLADRQRAELGQRLFQAQRPFARLYQGRAHPFQLVLGAVALLAQDLGAVPLGRGQVEVPGQVQGGQARFEGNAGCGEARFGVADVGRVQG